jgi:hypothetical protein
MNFLTVPLIQQRTKQPARTVQWWLKDLPTIGKCPGRGGAPKYATDQALEKIPGQFHQMLISSAAAASATVPILPPSGKVFSCDGARPSRAGAAADLLHPSSERVERRTLTWHEILTAMQSEGLPTIDDFVMAYNAGKIQVSDQARELEPTLNVETLNRWIGLARKNQLECRYGNRAGDTIFARKPELAKFVDAIWSANPRIRAGQLHTATVFQFPEIKISVNSVAAELRRRLKGNPALYEYFIDRDGYKNKFGVAVGSASAGLGRIGAQHQVDGTSLELWYLAEDGTPAKAHLNAGIEPISRFLWCHLSRIASAESSVATARKGISLVGVPDEILSDWGAEFLNRHVRRAIVRFLKIRWKKVSRPYSGDLKAFIERVFRTLLHQYIEVSPGYSGHSPIEAATIRKRNSFQQRRGERRNLIKLYGIKLSFEQLGELIENCVTIYNGTVHSATGVAPAQAIAQAKAAGQLRFLSAQDEKALDMLIGAGGTAIVSKKGVRVDSMFYWADELIPYRGRRIEYVKLRELGNIAVYSADDPATFIAIAQHPETAGLDRQVVALTAKTAEKRYMREQLGTLRCERRRFRPEKIWPAIIENKAALAAARLTETSSSNVISLPYHTDAISAARRAMDALDNMPARDAAVATTVTGEPADREARRRAKFERLSQIPPEQRSEDEAAWLAVYEEYGDLGPNFGRAS